MSLEELAEAFVEVSRSAGVHDPVPETLRVMMEHAGTEYTVSRDSRHAIGMFVIAVSAAEKRAELEDEFLDLVDGAYTVEEYEHLNDVAGGEA